MTVLRLSLRKTDFVGRDVGLRLPFRFGVITLAPAPRANTLQT